MGDSTFSELFSPASIERWRELVTEQMNAADAEERLASRTPEGLRVAPLYTADDELGADPGGMPGMPPFTRGGDLLPRELGWSVRAAVDLSDPARAAQQVAEELDGGATSILLRLSPCSGAALAAGAPALDARQLQPILAPLCAAGGELSLDAGPFALATAVSLLGALEAPQRGKLRGALGCDPIGALAASGEIDGSLAGEQQRLTDLAAWCSDHAPQLRALTVSALPYDAAAAAPSAQLACALATGVAYLRWLCDEGPLSIDEAALQLSFRFACDRDIFWTIALLRAARTTWARAIEACGGSQPAQRMVIEAHSSWRTRTARDPYVNAVRATAQLFGAVAGGADAVVVAPFDEPVRTPRPGARRLARNTSAILREEGHLARVLDPAGGSWYIEALTRQLAERAWSHMQRIKRGGGIVAALRAGTIQQAVAAAAAERRRAIAHRELPITGVSEFASASEPALERSDEPAQAAEVRAGAGVGAATAPADLRELVAGAASTGARGAITEQAVAAAARGVTLDALVAALAPESSSIRVIPLTSWRDAEPFEALRDRADGVAAALGRRPRAFVVDLGPAARTRPRVAFIADLLQAGGLEPVHEGPLESIEQALSRFADRGCDGAAVCWGGDHPPAQLSRLLAQLVERGARFVALAARPSSASEDESDRGERSDETAGGPPGLSVTAYLHAGCDAVATLGALLEKLEAGGLAAPAGGLP